MKERFVEIDPDKLEENPFRLIGKEWMLVTAGSKEDYNTMTASWGGLGFMWEKRIAFCMVRPTRYTYQFMERFDRYTLSFFDKKYKKALNYCGSHSGRDVDKAAGAGITPAGEGDAVWFAEARLVLVCRKIFTGDVDPSRLLDRKIEEFYPLKDYHRLYFGEIEAALVRE